MDRYRLLIGNRNHSSWSLRGWLAMRLSGLPFEAEVVPLFRDDTAGKMVAFSDAPARVPVLRRNGPAGDLVVWDSLAILEHAAERSPDAGLWPADPDRRAEARSVVAEMHSGFTALRTHMPMAIRERIDGRRDRPGVADDVARVFALWRRCLARSGGPFLFGEWSAADIFFAPVTTRLRTYGVPVPDDLAAYTEAVLAHPHVREWEAEAVREPWTVEIE
ncbi:glutathione S-transferase [Thalassobaculum sp.]|uniref:glutathione S-transferase n=1 Tax=Thalassobaculum sp. TaxID=2022740 RepID=UPI0032EB423C